MENQVIIDGKHAIMGRLASYVAKQSLLGKKVIILNSDEVIIMGNKKDIVKRYLIKVSRGGSSLKGPKMERNPERILKRAIRGMVSHKEGRGREAMKRIICYNTIPKEYENSKKVTSGKEKSGKFITLKELVSLIK